jgi:hypothetical protein
MTLILGLADKPYRKEGLTSFRKEEDSYIAACKISTTAAINWL